MKWRKLGLIFSPSGEYSWMQSHASLPVALNLGGDVYRVYFASRDAQHRSHIGYVDLDIRFPQKIVCLCTEPALTPGPIGHFDDHGVYAASILRFGATLFLYYIGWNPGIRRPLFYSSIGLATSNDLGLSFHKTSTAPIMSRSEFDPCLVTSPCVIIDSGIWRMWYVSGFKWEEISGSLYSYYHIKYAESKDGVEWERKGLVCIDLQPGERNVARPCVLKENGVYKMWYSYDRGSGYRIGYAESPDGYRWRRMDQDVGIELSPCGWDSKAMAYPWLFAHKGKKYILYNGNDFGRGGFGLAIETEGS